MSQTPQTREEWIEGLVADLEPSRGPRRVETLVGLWLLASWTAVVAATLWAGPLRDGWSGQLLSHPRFLLESLLGAVAGAAAIAGAFGLAIPGPGAPVRRLRLPLLLGGLWLASYAVGLAAPALPPSTEGARPGCTFQVLLFSLPPLLLALLMMRRLAPLRRAWTGAAAGAAAGAVPGLLMQVACMYVPAHILVHHLAPVAAVAALGAGLGALLLRRI